ncbi:MAG: 2-oxo acid dehydrogenase subunit E2, partial [Halobacteria archaeon]|nr:2-oxo acid dehydrogenase subunit E2 [Halobacteria archaeon]
MRRTIADRLGESYRNAVHVTVSREVDAEPLVGAVDAAEKDLGVDVSLTDVILKAVSQTLEDHPEYNAT